MRNEISETLLVRRDATRRAGTSKICNYFFALTENIERDRFQSVHRPTKLMDFRARSDVHRERRKLLPVFISVHYFVTLILSFIMRSFVRRNYRKQILNLIYLEHRRHDARNIRNSF